MAWAAVYLASDEARWITGVVLPVDAVLAIFAKENSQGIFFHDETGVKSTGEDDKSPTPAKQGGSPHLRLVE